MTDYHRYANFFQLQEFSVNVIFIYMHFYLQSRRNRENTNKLLLPTLRLLMRPPFSVSIMSKLVREMNTPVFASAK